MVARESSAALPREWVEVTVKVPLDGEVTALFASMWATVPVFHRFGDINRKDDDVVSADYTACGLLVSSYNRETGKLREPMTWVPMKHALVFGRPCAKCFPGADDE